MIDSIKSSISNYGRMIKFSHSIFALPFAIAPLFILYKDYPISPLSIFWIILAMVSARSASMGFNRYVDADIDKANPRTSDREIPAGKISKGSAAIFILISASLFIFSAFMLNRLCFYLSVPTLFLLLFYSYTKRFTSYSHYLLGLAIGLSPAGAWLAITGEFTFKPLLLILALATYIAGFDILYSCQDEQFDKSNKLFSLPSTFGRERSLKISSFTHLATFILFLISGFFYNLSTPYYYVVVIIGVVLIAEHKLITSDDISKIKIAFLYLNSIISVLFLIAVILGSLW